VGGVCVFLGGGGGGGPLLGRLLIFNRKLQQGRGGKLPWPIINF